jgi:hypothetical protein
MLDFDDFLIEAPCPACGYEFDVHLTDIRLEGTTFCPNCKRMIQLRDENASLEVGLREIEQALGAFGDAFRKLGG